MNFSTRLFKNKGQHDQEVTTVVRTAHTERGSRLRTLVAGMVLLGGSSLAIAGSPVTHADGQYGPATCSQGYVWREAFPGDQVCVTGDTRSQAAADNAQATARRNPNGGPYGTDTCLQGYVWREANPSDHVCVTPATRSLTAYDNSQANSRLASVHPSMPVIWMTDWTVPPVCNGDVCSTTSDDDIPRFQVNGDNFTIGGSVWIGYTNYNTGVRTYTYSNTAGSYSGYSLGSFGHKTDQFDCTSDPNAPTNFFVQAYDWSSRTWSNRLYVKVCTAVL